MSPENVKTNVFFFIVLYKKKINFLKAFVEIAAAVAGKKELNAKLKIDRRRLMAAFQALGYDLSAYEVMA